MSARRFRCSSCGRRHRRFRDARRTKPAAYCVRCHTAYMRRARRRYLENKKAMLSALCARCRKRFEKLFTVEHRRGRR